MLRRRLGAQIIIFHGRHCWRRPHREPVPRHRMDELRSSLRRTGRRRDDLRREERPRVPEEGVLRVVEEGPAFETVGRAFLWKDAAPSMPTSSFWMWGASSPQDGASNIRSSKMACGGNQGEGYAHSALIFCGERRTSVDCMLPRPHHRESGAAPAPRRPGRGALRRTRTTNAGQKAGRAARRAY